MKNMKSKLILITVLCSGLAQSAQASTLLDSFKDYGLPCLVGMGLSMALAKDNGAAIGGAVCGAAISLMAIENAKMSEGSLTESDRMRVDAMIKREVKLSDDEMVMQFNEGFKKVAQDQDKLQQEIRKLIRDVIAERMVLLESDNRVALREAMAKADFLPSLEKKIMNRIKDEVAGEVRIRKADLVKEVTDDVLNSVTAKPVEIPAGRVSAPRAADAPAAQ